MELKSANAGANWHPLTSLITFDSLENHRVHYFLAALDGTPDYFSTLLHEVSHLMSARFGRLGFYLSHVAAHEYSKWRQDRSATLTLNISEWRVLGAGEGMSLLEGLLLDKNRADLNYYTFGYFYVKAVQAQWAQRCPAFQSPAVFLPFFLKFITDHPGVAQCGR